MQHIHLKCWIIKKQNSDRLYEWADETFIQQLGSKTLNHAGTKEVTIFYEWANESLIKPIHSWTLNNSGTK